MARFQPWAIYTSFCNCMLVSCWPSRFVNSRNLLATLSALYGICGWSIRFQEVHQQHTNGALSTAPASWKSCMKVGHTSAPPFGSAMLLMVFAFCVICVIREFLDIYSSS